MKALQREILYPERQLEPARLLPLRKQRSASEPLGKSWVEGWDGGCCPPSAQPLPTLLGTAIAKGDALGFGTVRRVSGQNWNKARVLWEPQGGYQVEVTSASHQPGT